MRWGFLALSLLFLPMSQPVLADDAPYNVRFCVPDEIDFRGKFERALKAAYAGDFNGFRLAGALSENDLPPVVMVSSGALGGELAMVALAGLPHEGVPPPKVKHWTLLHKVEPSPAKSYRLYHATVTKASIYKSEPVQYDFDYFVHFYDGCALKMIQETEVPYFVREEADG